MFNLYIALSRSSGWSTIWLLWDFDPKQFRGYLGIVLCLARPQAMSWAKLGHDDGFIVALAWLAWLKSQSQAVRPWLFSEL